MNWPVRIAIRSVPMLITAAMSLCMLCTISFGQSAWTRLPGTFSRLLQIRFFDRDTGFVLYGEGAKTNFVKTTDGGLTWHSVLLPVDNGNSFQDFYLFHNNCWIVGVANSHDKPIRVIYSSDLGYQWSVLPFDSSRFPYEVAFSGKDSGYVLYRLDTNQEGQFCETYPAFTSDGGKHWISRQRRFCTTSLKIGYSSNIFVSDLIQDPPDFAQVFSKDYGVKFTTPTASVVGTDYCYCGNQIWIAGGPRSTDGGESWNTFFGMSQAWSDTNGTVYAMNSYQKKDSLLVSHDRGISGIMLPFYHNTYPNHIEVVDSLFAYAVSGNSLYKTSSGGVGSFEESNVLETDKNSEFQIIAEGQNYVLKFALLQSTNLSITVFDVLGREFYSFATRAVEPFEHYIQLDLKNIPSGTYFVRVSLSTGEVRTLKLVKE
jgi:hypothetical protein